VSPGRRGSSAQQSRELQGPWRIYFFARTARQGGAGTVPAREFLDAVPTKVAATIIAVLKAVAEAPPPKFAGGGKWEAMHGEMKGIYEIRVDGPKRRHYRLFCLLERDGARFGLNGPSVVALTGLSKGFRTEFTPEDYRLVRQMRDEYGASLPRSVLRDP
jgi:Txe/YoeB family toxin of Txe-Axe toxin-antitoxin module